MEGGPGLIVGAGIPLPVVHMLSSPDGYLCIRHRATWRSRRKRNRRTGGLHHMFVLFLGRVVGCHRSVVMDAVVVASGVGFGMLIAVGRHTGREWGQPVSKRHGRHYLKTPRCGG